MKTIAISIDEETLRALTRITRDQGRRRSRGGRPVRALNRSELVRRAVREFVERQERTHREAGERQVFARHRELLDRQAAALVGEQAEP